MKAAVAIKKLMEREPHGRHCTAQELKEFKTACTPEEYKDLGRQAAGALGEPFEE